MCWAVIILTQPRHGKAGKAHRDTSLIFVRNRSVRDQAESQTSHHAGIRAQVDRTAGRMPDDVWRKVKPTQPISRDCSACVSVRSLSGSSGRASDGPSGHQPVLAGDRLTRPKTKPLAPLLNQHSSPSTRLSEGTGASTARFLSRYQLVASSPGIYIYIYAVKGMAHRSRAHLLVVPSFPPLPRPGVKVAGTGGVTHRPRRQK